MVAVVAVEVFRGQNRDRHGDAVLTPVAVETQGRFAPATPTVDFANGAVTVSKPMLYFRRYPVNINPGDQVKVMGKKFLVEQVAAWEHPRIEGKFMGVAITLEGGAV